MCNRQLRLPVSQTGRLTPPPPVPGSSSPPSESAPPPTQLFRRNTVIRDYSPSAPTASPSACHLQSPKGVPNCLPVSGVSGCRQKPLTVLDCPWPLPKPFGELLKATSVHGTPSLVPIPLARLGLRSNVTSSKRRLPCPPVSSRSKHAGNRRVNPRGAQHGGTLPPVCLGSPALEGTPAGTGEPGLCARHPGPGARKPLPNRRVGHGHSPRPPPDTRRALPERPPAPTHQPCRNRCPTPSTPRPGLRAQDPPGVATAERPELRLAVRSSCRAPQRGSAQGPCGRVGAPGPTHLRPAPPGLLPPRLPRPRAPPAPPLPPASFRPRPPQPRSVQKLAGKA